MTCTRNSCKPAIPPLKSHPTSALCAISFFSRFLVAVLEVVPFKLSAQYLPLPKCCHTLFIDLPVIATVTSLLRDTKTSVVTLITNLPFLDDTYACPDLERHGCTAKGIASHRGLDCWQSDYLPEWHHQQSHKRSESKPHCHYRLWGR